jgi:hypothetical protein
MRLSGSSKNLKALIHDLGPLITSSISTKDKEFLALVEATYNNLFDSRLSFIS